LITGGKTLEFLPSKNWTIEQLNGILPSKNLTIQKFNHQELINHEFHLGKFHHDRALRPSPGNHGLIREIILMVGRTFQLSELFINLP